MNTGRTHFKKGFTPWNKGKKINYSQSGKHWKIKDTSKMKGRHPYSEFKKGLVPWNRGTKGVMKAWNKDKKVPQISRENHYAWKGNIQTIKKDLLIERNYICENCGWREPEIMEVHHRLPVSKYPELRDDKNNLQVLCPNCHRRITNLFLKSKTKI
jgi:5-methylcytosine-specific restriction endonuclease McrA